MPSVRDLQRRLNGALLLERLPALLWAGASAFAATRILWPAASVWVPLATLAAAGALLARRLRAQAWSEADAAVLLDRLAGAGGLLLTLREVPDPRWQPLLAQKLAQAKAPPMAWKRPLLASLAAGAFALAAWLVPHPASVLPQAQVAAQNALAQLAAREAALAEETPVPEQLQQELARMREEADEGTFDAADWEAADNVGDALEQAAKARAEALQKAAQQAERYAQTLAQTSDAEAQAREREALEDALSALDGSEKPSSGSAKPSTGSEKPSSGSAKPSTGSEKPSTGSEKPSSGSAKPSSGSEKPSSGMPKSRADAQALRDALEQRKEQLSKAFPNASPKGSPSPGQGQQPGQGSGGAHHPGHGGNPGNGDATEVGQGGPGHGSAPDTPLRFGDETRVQEDRLQFAPLPQGHGGEDSGVPWGLSRRAPTLNTDAALGSPTGAAPGGDDSPGGRTGIVPPRHRDLVRRYFDQNARTPARSP